ncbi:unnamed protein product [Cylindrotheca closterium]|uniref:BZIP domain-containing protein n=1 Tax=Cylindrotheca closterium TaxID=2856 RepID=A0AAD2CYT5_9STRA|nr:unnamed protein product [Cylindrotheca closterium]
MVTGNMLPDARNAKGEEGIMYHGATRDRGEKKKVGWKKTISTSESSNDVEDRSPNWDSETGNMLSYFLGDPMSGGENYASAMAAHQNQKMEYDIPPTPATRYYYHHPDSKPKASYGESMSLNNPLMRMKVSNSADNSIHAGDQPMGGVLSPISPTTMFGLGQEPLMLPPPPNSHNEAYKNHINLLQMHNVANEQQRVEEAQNISSIPPPPNSQNEAYKNHIGLYQMNSAANAGQRVAEASTREAQITNIPPPPGMSMPQPLHYTGVPSMQPVNLQTVVNPALYSHAALMQQHASSAGESEEKRAKRLERNRESARRSRRKKKERLSSLEEKVSNLYQRIETERRNQINCMDDAFEDDLKDSVATMRTLVGHTAEQDQKAKLGHFLQSTGMNSKVRRSVLDFQYTTLKQTILPPYHKFLLWMTLHPDKFFTHARESHVIQDTKKVRPPPGKLSSKQVGEELANIDKGKTWSQSAQAVDKTRMWPLFCFELSVSVDQEEKMLHTLKKVRQLQFINERRSQMESATKMATHLKEAMMYQSHAVSVRSAKTLTDILTPQQTLKYKEWMGSNRDRCKAHFENRMKLSRSASSQPSDKTSLSDVCRKLEKIVISQEMSCTDNRPFPI